MKTPRAFLLLVFGAAIGMAGCMNKDGRTSDSASGYGARAGQGIDNSMLTSRVKTALAAQAGLKTLILNVDSNDGVVTVSGTVKSQAISDSVTHVARSVDGVSSVNNRLVVQPDD